MAVSKGSKTSAAFTRGSKGRITSTTRVRIVRRIVRALLCAFALQALEDHVPAAPLQGVETVSFSGPQGGPFTTDASTHTLTNPLNRALPWFFVESVPWLTCTPVLGVLPANSTVDVQVAIDPAVANLLAQGVYGADIVYRNRTNPSGASALLHFELTVGSSSLDSGWTDLRPSADTRLVYVSSAHGDDANNGLSANAAKRTIAAAKALVRNGYPDWLLLERGGTWNEAVGQWIASGRSTREPAVITSFGSSSERPLLLTGASDGVFGLASGASPQVLHDVAIVGLHFRAHTYNGGNGEPAGVNWLIESHGLLVEDCEFERYQINVSVPGYGGRKRDVRIRRNVIVDAFATSGTVGHGIYMANCDDVLIEDNVLDHNGWNTSVPGAVPSIFRHGIYIQSGSGTCTNVTVRGNIIADSASHGLHLRPGGVCEDNLFLRNPIAISLGGGNEPDPGGVIATARGNVILEGRDIDAQNRRGWGIDLANIAAGNVSFNIVAQQGASGSPIAMNLYGNLNGIGVHETTIEHNVIWNWGGALILHGTAEQCTNIDFVGNALRNTVNERDLVEHMSSSTTASLSSFDNRFLASAPAEAWMTSAGTSCSLVSWKHLVGDTTSGPLMPADYPDPERTIARYDASVGGAGSYAAFMQAARAQSRANWRPQYTARAAIEYVRAGFGLEVP